MMNREENGKNPEAILVQLGLRTGFTFVDIGCGHGFFTLPAARIVAEKGKVYGLDVDENAIALLRKKTLKEGLTNLTLQVGEAEKTIFCESCADVVFFGIVFHDFDDQAKVLANARRMLRNTGRLVNLDWKKEAMELGPPLRIRFGDKEAANLIRKAGFHIQAIKDAEPYHYVVVARLLWNR
jgi:ubiquinone/menaquinone biosynthesis C-methylase UbiE